MHMSEKAAKDCIKGDVGHIAEELIMADLSDSSVLQGVRNGFARIAEALDPYFPRCARTARAAADALGNKPGKEDLPDDDALLFAEKTISALQSFMDREVDEDTLDLPEGVVPPGSAGFHGKEDDFSDATPGGVNPPDSKTNVQAGSVFNGGPGFASGVDRDILEEYLVQQETVIAEIEELVLSYEQEADYRIVAELKRYLHTAKGEAGVIGLNAVADVCHQVEDYIQEEGENLQADLLLEFKDWFEQTVAAVKNGEPVPPADTLMGALCPGAETPGAAGNVEASPKSGFDESSAPVHDRPAPPAGRAPSLSAGASPEAQSEKFCPFPETNGGQKALPETFREELDALMQPVFIEDPEITADFVSETNEHFEVSDENLLTLENDPEDEEAIASIFRAFHTIKGTTSFLGLTPISRLAHIAENLLDEVRKKRLGFEGEVVDATFNALDLLKKMTRQLESALENGSAFTPDDDFPEVFVQLKKVLSGERELPPVRGAMPPPAEEMAKVDASGSLNPDISADSPSEQESAPEANGSGRTKTGRSVRQTMKIDADRIDLLLETIGELVIIESIVSQEVTRKRNGDSRELERNLGQLTKITRSLQDMGMSMRLIPIDNTFRKMGRLVRDLAKKSGKKIELSMEGKETELDKGMVEQLGDPLVHMVRNAVDHGIESTPEERVAAGKDPAGKIVLRAYHQGGGIHIEIRDDGRGLDREVLAAKAIERGVIKNADNMSDEEVFSLIFAPGFSTAAQITDISGRGVGMDVVKSNIESMRGNVRISSEKGKGSVFTLILPLTMAIIDGMIVRLGSERYILPLLSIIESFKPTREMITTVSGKGETVPFRNRLLPLFRLSSLFDTPDAETDPTRALVVVIEDAGRQVGLLVDELLGQNQTVIKNLGEGLRQVEGIAGASIMADGIPGLIIDVNGLVKMATA